MSASDSGATITFLLIGVVVASLVLGVLRFAMPQRWRRLFEVWDRKRALTNSSNPLSRHISVGSERVELSDVSGSLGSTLWAETAEVAAYKRDLFTVDQLCLTIRSFTGTEIEITEDDIGYKEALDAFELRLPGFQRREIDQVIQPPFAENYTVIWRRAKSTFR